LIMTAPLSFQTGAGRKAKTGRFYRRDPRDLNRFRRVSPADRPPYTRNCLSVLYLGHQVERAGMDRAASAFHRATTRSLTLAAPYISTVKATKTANAHARGSARLMGQLGNP